MAKRVEDSALNLYARLIRASKCKGEARVAALLDADVELETLRGYVRLCHEFKLLSTNQFEHAARLMVEVGSLLGAWIKKPQQQ
jgi:hypothetical protein